jgi:hypothetical protein
LAIDDSRASASTTKSTGTRLAGAAPEPMRMKTPGEGRRSMASRTK